MQAAKYRAVHLVAALSLASTAAWGQDARGFAPGEMLAPFVPSPAPVVEAMLELAGTREADTLYDLGSGDGRIVLEAAQRYGARAVGIEIDMELAKKTQRQIDDLRLQNRAQIIHGDMLQQDVSEATVVTMYLTGASNERLRPWLEAQLKPGTRVVTHDFQIRGWKADAVEDIRGPGRMHKLYLYRIP